MDFPPPFYRWTGPWGEPGAFTGRYAGGEAYLTPAILGYALIGCLIGTLVGMLPGVGPLAGISLLLPATFGLGPTAAIVCTRTRDRRRPS